MKILTTSTDAQEMTIIPRSYPALIDIRLRDESTNTVTLIEDVAATTNKGYLIFSTAYSLTENVFYELTILSGSDVIYKDKVFCTDQVIADYTLNENEYITENTYDNDYILL
jgi:hypothetical protein